MGSARTILGLCLVILFVGGTLATPVWRMTNPSKKLSFCGTKIMMTSSNGTISRVTGSLCGEFTDPGEFPAQRPGTRSLDIFFDLRPNKRLSKQPWGWWFETPSWSLWRQCDCHILTEKALRVVSTQQTHCAIITSLLRQTTSFWRNYIKMTSCWHYNDVIITSCLRWVVTMKQLVTLIIFQCETLVSFLGPLY